MQRFRGNARAWPALVVVGLLAACAPAAEPTTMEPAATEVMTEATTPPETGAGQLGSMTIAAGAPIKLAYMLVTAGADQSLGIDSRNGIELAIDDLNGTFMDHPLELDGEDTGCTAEGGQTAATKLAADATILAIIGTSCSSEARPAAPIISEAGLTMVSPSNTAPDLTDPASHAAGYLRTAHNDKVQGKVAAEFVYNELGLRKVATIHDGSPYAEGLVGAFTENFTGLGGTITSAEAVSPTDTDMKPVLTTIAAGAPEMVYFPIFTAAGGFVASQSKDIPELATVKLMGADGLFSPDFLKAAGTAALGMYLSSPDFSTFGSDYAEQFVPAYEAKFGSKPISAFHAHAYDATNMILDALERTAVVGADGSLTVDRQALRDALFATSNFQGLTGSLTCNEYGDCADPRIAVYEISQDNLDKGEVPTTKIYPMGDTAGGTTGGSGTTATEAPAMGEATATP
jgi:branched-chain amino acid transport system substrate-binding protein